MPFIIYANYNQHSTSFYKPKDFLRYPLPLNSVYQCFLLIFSLNFRVHLIIYKPIFFLGQIVKHLFLCISNQIYFLNLYLNQFFNMI